MSEIYFSNGGTYSPPNKKEEISEHKRALLAFFNSLMIQSVRMPSSMSLENFIYDDFKFELDGRFLDELYELFSHYGIYLIKETVNLKICFMRKWNNATAFVITITSGLCSPVEERKNLPTIQTVCAMDKDLVQLFYDFNLKYMREMFNCTVENLDFHLALACLVPMEEFPE